MPPIAYNTSWVGWDGHFKNFFLLAPARSTIQEGQKGKLHMVWGALSEGPIAVFVMISAKVTTWETLIFTQPPDYANKMKPKHLGCHDQGIPAAK